MLLALRRRSKSVGAPLFSICIGIVNRNGREGLSDEEGIGVTFVADGGSGTVAGVDHGAVG